MKKTELVVTVKLARKAHGDIGHAIESLAVQTGKPRATVVRELLEGALTEKPIDERIAALAHENDAQRLELVHLRAQTEAVVPALQLARAELAAAATKVAAAEDAAKQWEAKYHAAETAAIDNGFFAECWRAKTRFYAWMAPGGPFVCWAFLAIRDGLHFGSGQGASLVAAVLLLANAIRLRLASVRVSHR